MEESQISVLPPELVAEAQTLRRDWEARNRQLMQERFLSQITQSNNALSSMLRSSGRGNRGPRYAIHPVSQRNPHWSSQWGPSFASRNQDQRQLRNTVVRVRGRQLLDLESISCLLVLLFQNNPKIHVLRFYRCMRNFCYNGPTRDWVIKALLSILDKCVNARPIDTPSGGTPNLRRSKRLASKVSGECTSQNWLNINLEAALGCKTNVFIVNKGSVGSKKGEKRPPSIDIHHQAALIAGRQTLDLLIQLAKSFPSCFLPLRIKSGYKKKHQGPPKAKSVKTAPDFWDLLLKLDGTKPPAPIKKYTFPPRTYPNIHGPDSDWNFASTFESSGFGQLITMLDTPMVQGNPQLVDKFLRLLYMITRGLPELPAYLSGNKHIVRFRYIEKYESIMNYEDKLRIIVNTITWKRCTEEGLDCATLMLHNLSHVSDSLRKTIVNLLWYGAYVLSRVVDVHIKALLRELQKMKEHNSFDDPNDPKSSISAGGQASSSGILNDRFTKEPIIVTASTKQRQTCDLQLSSMDQLVYKNSSQAYFLKLLRVIVQVLDTKKKDENVDNKENVSGAAGDNVEGADGGEQAEGADGGDQAEAASTSSTATGSKSSQASDDSTPMDTTSDTGSQQGFLVGLLTPATFMDSKAYENKPLSSMLSLGNIWHSLSKCLLELEHTPDHHAVLVLQPAVEAFFLVHTTPKRQARRSTYIVDDAPTIYETVDIPSEDNNVFVPPLSPIVNHHNLQDNQVDLLYSSDSDEARNFENAESGENDDNSTPPALHPPPAPNPASADRPPPVLTPQIIIPQPESQEVPRSLILGYEVLAWEKMEHSGGLPTFMTDEELDEVYKTKWDEPDEMCLTPEPGTSSSDERPMDDKHKFVAFAGMFLSFFPFNPWLGASKMNHQ